MDTKLTDKVFEYIDALAQKLGVASELIFRFVTKQVVTEGITYTALSLVGLLFVFVAYKVINKILAWTKKDIVENDNEWADYPHSIISIIIIGVFSLICFILIVFNILPESIMKIANPEYYTLKEIMSVING